MHGRGLAAHSAAGGDLFCWRAGARAPLPSLDPACRAAARGEWGQTCQTGPVPCPQVEELRREIEVLSQNHEREVDRKDAMVQVGGVTPTRARLGAARGPQTTGGCDFLLSLSASTTPQ